MEVMLGPSTPQGQSPWGPYPLPCTALLCRPPIRTPLSSAALWRLGRRMHVGKLGAGKARLPVLNLPEPCLGLASEIRTLLSQEGKLRPGKS